MARLVASHVPPDPWLHPSTRADFLFVVTKRVLKWLLIVPVAWTTINLGMLLHDHLPHPMTPIAAPIWVLGMFAISMVIMHDFGYYLYHRAQHSNAFLWEFHKVHHSAEQMAGVTDQRVHPFDDMMFYAWIVLPTSLLYGLWLLVIEPPGDLLIYGLSAVTVCNLLTFGFARHLPYKLSFGRLNSVLVCPHYHQLHHSTNPKHYNRNYGIMFTVWDRAFGTLMIPNHQEDFTYGLGEESAAYHSLRGSTPGR